LIHGTTALVREGLRGYTEVFSSLYAVVQTYIRWLRVVSDARFSSAQMMWQGAIQFTTYIYYQFVQGTTSPGQQLLSTTTFVIGVIVGLVMVYAYLSLLE
jgi:hypothetical protein